MPCLNKLIIAFNSNCIQKLFIVLTPAESSKMQLSVFYCVICKLAFLQIKWYIIVKVFNCVLKMEYHIVKVETVQMIT